MSGTACSSACGWCGMCTSAWEGPDTVGTTCVRCAAEMEIPKDEVGEIHWCEDCQETARRKREQRQQRIAS